MTDIQEVDDYEDDLAIVDGPETALFEGDQGILPLLARKALVLLLKRTHVAALTHPKEWRALLDHQGEITSRLNDMFLDLVMDERNEVAYKRQAGRELGRVFTTLLTNRAYSREEAALLLHLRTVHQRARARGDSVAHVERSEIPSALEYVKAPDTADHVQAREAIEKAIDRLCNDDFLLKVKDDQDRLRVSPVIETLLTVERTKAFADAVYGAIQGESPIDTDTQGEFDDDE